MMWIELILVHIKNMNVNILIMQGVINKLKRREQYLKEEA